MRADETLIVLSDVPVDPVLSASYVTGSYGSTPIPHVETTPTVPDDPERTDGDDS